MDKKKYVSNSSTNFTEQNRSNSIPITNCDSDKAKLMKERVNNKREQQIDTMPNDQIVNELK